MTETASRPGAKQYGRGLFDGLRLAGITNPEEYMNEAKLARVESGLNAMARKVLDAVPIAEPWTKHQIAVEMRRRGSGVQVEVIQGCLSSLCDSGLIKEPSHGSFVRASVRAKTATAPAAAPAEKLPQPAEVSPVLALVTPQATPSTTKAQPVTAADASQPARPPMQPLDKLAKLAKEARDMAAACSALADRIETVALEVEERAEKESTDTAKLRQLTALMKEVMG